MELVSVIMPYYKKKKYFELALNSILNQHYQNFEIIIVFDDEDDDELNFVKQKIYRDKRIHLIVNESNKGVAFSRNKALKRAKGEYLAFLDSDDLWEKEKLSFQIEFMKKNNILFSHTAYSLIDEHDDKIGVMNVKKNIKYKNLIFSCDIGLSTVILHRDLLKIGFFPDLKTKEDYALWLLYAKSKIEIVGINKVFASWRKSSKSLSSSFLQRIADAFRVYNNCEKKGIILSFLLVITLSLNFILKGIRQKYYLN